MMETPEGTKEILVCLCIAVVAIVEQADQRGNAKRTCHQHNFIMRVSREVAHLCDDRAGILKFALGQTHFAHEAVQMFDQ